MAWTTMVKIPDTGEPMRNMEQVTWQNMVGATGATKAKAKKILRKAMSEVSKQENWRNDLYKCAVMPVTTDGITELAITRLDREAIHDWRDIQRIKNDVMGAEREAVELYPSESRLVDTSNTYWLYDLPEGAQFSFGMTDGRSIATAKQASLLGAVQRDFD